MTVKCGFWSSVLQQDEVAGDISCLPVVHRMHHKPAEKNSSQYRITMGASTGFSAESGSGPRNADRQVDTVQAKTHINSSQFKKFSSYPCG
jgi:hypothetical protein